MLIQIIQSTLHKTIYIEQDSKELSPRSLERLLKILLRLKILLGIKILLILKILLRLKYSFKLLKYLVQFDMSKLVQIQYDTNFYDLYDF